MVPQALIRLGSNLLVFLVCFGAVPVLAAKAPPICDRVRYLATAGEEQAMVGGTFAGSNVSRAEGFEVLAEIKGAPPKGQWGEITFPNTKIYRWLRYTGPAGATKGLGEVEFYADDVNLSEKGMSISYVSFTENQFAGFDLVDRATAQRPSIKPDLAEQPGPLDVTLGSTKGAVIRYTLDGSWPTADHGTVYTGPIHIDKTTRSKRRLFSKAALPA
jgi:hypothetical protein